MQARIIKAVALVALLSSVLCLPSSRAASPLPATGFWNVTQAAVLSGTTASLSWNAATFPASGYNLYDIKTGARVLLGTATSTSTQLTGLTSGYRLIVVTAIRASDGAESAMSVPIILIMI